MIIWVVKIFFVQFFLNTRQWRPTPVLLSGKFHGWRSLEGCSPWGCWGSDMTEWLHFHFSLSCFGEGNGNPLQCSCLENPRDWGAWWAAIYRVAQSQTRRKRLSSSSSRNETKTKYIFLIINHSVIAINSFTEIVCYYLFTYCWRLHLWQSCTLVRGSSSCDTVHSVFHLALYRRILLTFSLCQWFPTLVHIIIICHRIHHQEFLSHCFRIGTWASVVFKNLVGDYNMQSGLRITG